MSVLDTFYLVFKGDTKGAEKDIDKLNKGAAELAESVSKLAVRTFAALGVGMSAVGITEFISNTAKENFELDKLAQRLHSTAGAVDDFMDSASLLGISSDKSTEGLQSLSRAVEDTAMGLGRAKKVFEEIGVSATDVHGRARPVMDVFDDLQKKMEGMEQGKKLRIMERLGIDPSMLKLFSANMGDLRKRMDDIDRGTGFSLDHAIKLSKEFTTTQRELGVEVNSLKMYFQKLGESFAVNSMPFFIDLMKKAKVVLHDVFEFVVTHKDLVVGFFIAVAGAVTAYFLPAMFKAASATLITIAPFVLAGLAIAALAAAFALAYDDVMTFLDGGESVTGLLLEKFPIITDIINAMRDAFSWLSDVASSAFDVLMDGAKIVWGILQILFNGVSNGIKNIYERSALIKLLVAAWVAEFQFLKKIVGEVWDFIFGKIKSVLGFFGDLTKMLPGALKDLHVKATGVLEGQNQMRAISSSPISAISGQAMVNNSRGNTNLTTGPITIQSQATDANGLAKDLTGAMHNQVRQVAWNFDDGIAY